MDIEFKGQYTKEAFTKAVIMATKPTGRFALIRNILLGLIIVLVIFSIAPVFSAPPEDNLRFIRPLVALLILGYVLVIPGVNARRIANRLWKNEAQVQEPFFGKANSNALSFLTPEPARHFEWQEISSLRQADEVLVLLPAEGGLRYFLSDFFKSSADWQAFRDLASQKVTPPQKTN